MISKIFNFFKGIKRSYYTFRVKRTAKSVGRDLTVNNYSYVSPGTVLGDNVNFNGMKIQGRRILSLKTMYGLEIVL